MEDGGWVGIWPEPSALQSVTHVQTLCHGVRPRLCMYPGNGRAEDSQGCTAVNESRDPGSREVLGARHGAHPCCPVLGKKAECTPEGRRHLTSCHQEGHGRVGSREGRGPQRGRQEARGTR